MAGSKSEGKGWRPGGGGEPVRRGAKPEWIPTTEKPKRGTRRIKQFALVVLGLGIIGTGVWLYYLLLPPSPPVLLVFCADPGADVDDLNSPIDPYGWMSSKALVKWSDRYRAAAPEEKKRHAPTTSDGSNELKNDETFKTEQELAKWAVDKAHASFKPSETAIIYFGLHTGADGKGAFLYANKGRRFHVRPLLKSLAEGMGDTKVLVLFDPARLLPDPAHGQLSDGFVDGVKALNDEIAGYRNLSVILGCDSGERGWESEELQRTAFAHAVIEALGGRAKPSDENTITARDLYDSVKRDTEEWTRRNRPSVQHPVLLPSTDIGEQRAGGTKLALHHTLDTEAVAAVRDPLPAIATQWRVYGELAAKSPAPDVYTPRRWRHYRDLLMRYEFVARAGEDNSEASLRASLGKEAEGIRNAVRTPIVLSAAASTQLWQAAGRDFSPNSNSELRSAGNGYLSKPNPETIQAFSEKFEKLRGDRLSYSVYLIDRALEPGDTVMAERAVLLRKMWEDDPIRPADVQLFLMLNQFYRQLAIEPLPEEPDPKGGPLKLWQKAVQVRRLAEVAALGPTAGGHPYSEVLWRIVQPIVVEGDAHRRKAEDRLFAPPGKERTESFALLERAEEFYLRAKARADQVRPALALRDRVLADLPYLGRWATFEGVDKFTTDHWKAIHKLAKLIDELPAESAAGVSASPDKYLELGTAVEAVRKNHDDDLAKEYSKRLLGESNNPEVKLQVPWLERERLLAVPPLTASPDGIRFRLKLIEVNRRATTYFIDPKNAVDTKSDDKKDRIAIKDRAIALGFLGLNELGEDLIAKQKQASDAHESSDQIKSAINKIKDGKWDDAASAGENLGQHYWMMAAVPDPAATAAEASEAERFSRFAVTFKHRDGMEPAEANRKLRWQRLLAAQAHRTVSDHWYDGKDRPYYQSVAKAFVDDAEALAPGQDLKALLGSRFEEFEKLRKAEPLKLAASLGDSRWTTESKKSVGFSLSAAVLPPEAQAVVWATFEPRENAGRKVEFAKDVDARRVQILTPGATPLEVTLVTEAAITVKQSATVRRSAFFRGQHVPADATLALNRMPDLVSTHARPQEGDPLHPPRVAFVGPDHIDVGTVTIIIDYSPSMTNKPKNNPNEKPRIERAWVALQEILRSLPDGTRLTVRGFGVAPTPGQRIDSETFESANTAGGTDATGQKWTGTFDRHLLTKPVDWGAVPANLGILMDQLKNMPLGADDRNSPVVRTMLHSAREDFQKVDDHQTKVLVVLTDGADNSSWKENGTKLHFPPLLEKLEKEFKQGSGRGITVRMLLIEEKDFSTDDEKDQIKEFTPLVRGVLDGFEPPGSVLVGEVKDLGKELAELLRPRVRLNREGVKLPEALRAGVPIRFDNRKPKPEPPEWSALPSPGEYEAWVGQKPLRERQSLLFDPADLMLLRLSRADMLVGMRERVQFERVVWGREGDFGRALKLANRQQEKPEQNWLLSVAMYRTAIHGYGNVHVGEGGRDILDLRAALESVDPARLKPADGQTIRQFTPDFVWWELDEEPPVKETKTPVYVWREYGHPAPVWRLRRGDWRSPNNDIPKGTLRGWMPRQLKLPAERARTTLTEVTTVSATGSRPEGQPWSDTWHGELADGQKWTAKFDWEQHAFATNPDSKETDKPRLSLVVRVYLDERENPPLLDGKRAPLFVQVHGSQIEEHRFFRASGAYTGYFHFGPSTSLASAANREVKLFAAVDLTEPMAGIPFELPLPKPESDGSDRVWNVWDQIKPKLPQEK